MLQRSPFLAIYMLSYMEIFTCFVWCSLILFYYVIKMEIKQLKRFFFCHYFNLVLSRNSYTTSILQMYIVGNLVQRNSTCILYFGYVELRITRSIFSIPLDFEITRLTCIYINNCWHCNIYEQDELCAQLG